MKSNISSHWEEGHLGWEFKSGIFHPFWNRVSPFQASISYLMDIRVFPDLNCHKVFLTLDINLTHVIPLHYVIAPDFHELS
jgi:hypothetical protein